MEPFGTLAPRLTHTSGLSYGCGFGESPSDATEEGYARLVKAVDDGAVRNLEDFTNRVGAALGES